ncbi:hypothetical protein [Pararobbsia alpina]|uniref:Uncharacterized protein n=1 Tax=Pararobbsia alpina TaxID=621374 RepID=A0A6S7BBA2_9BURK|nr:hypothetical protein [Pararobbsia alpina]CAB3784268.1 hypothetical protein LMG28138_01775 [Pararobbsia alpina]
MMMKRFLAVLLLLVSAAAHAQFTPGQILTAAQLNSALAAKLSLTGGTLTGPLTAQSLSLIGAATLPSVAITGGTITGLSALTAPTQPAGDSSSNAATTQFVSSGLLNRLTHVSNQAALQSITTTVLGAFTAIHRDGYTAAGDGGQMDYVWSSSACSLNSGAGDNGSQVPASGGGCWNWSPPASGVTAMVFGAAGNGTATDTTALQSTINATAAAKIPLLFDAQHLYKTTAPLTVSTPLKIVGPYRYGVWQTASTNTQSYCAWGILATGNTDVLVLNAQTGTLTGVCIQPGTATATTAANAATSATAGAAVKLAPVDASHYISGWTIAFNTILHPYDGIAIDGTGASSNCCGAGTAADGNLIANNTIVNPADAGIANGRNTVYANTTGNNYYDNAILCINSTSQANGIGFLLADGAVNYEGTDNGPLGCHIGMALIPGSISGQNQNVGLRAHGVLGDQSGLYGLEIAPYVPSGASVGGAVQFVSFDAAWAASTSNQTAIYASCPANTSCNHITFNNIIAHGGSGQTVPIMNVQQGQGGPNDFSIVNSTLCSTGAAGTGEVALNLSLAYAAHVLVNNNRIGSNCGPGGSTPTQVGLALSIAHPTGNGQISIIGNDFSDVQSGGYTPISYTPYASGGVNGDDVVIVKDNLGVNQTCATVAAAASITAPASSDCLNVTVTTSAFTVNDILGNWAGRELRIFVPGNGSSTALTLNASGGGEAQRMCSTLTIPAWGSATLYHNYAYNCWASK